VDAIAGYFSASERDLTMDPLEPFLLPPDVLLTAVTDLPDHIRSQVSGDGEFAITRPRARSSTRMLSRDAAELLEEFRTAKTVVEAVISYCAAKGSEPESTLEEAFPILQNLVAAQFLVPADSENSMAIQPGFEGGRVADGYTIVKMVQTLEDSEVYQVSGPGGQLGAMKIARSADNRAMAKALRREAQILRLLDGASAPQLLAEGEVEKRPYVVMSWIEGRTAVQMADELRQRGEFGKLVSLCVTILRAYGSLHARDVLHCDVHPRNVIVREGAEAVIIDFGLAVQGASEKRASRHVPRGGVAMFFEPEYAEARMVRKTPPPATQASEQYALGALMYLLIAGHPYLTFDVGKTEMLQQIASAEPLPLEKLGIRELVEIEGVIFRALSKEPAARFPSVKDFASALEAAKPAAMPSTPAIGGKRKAFSDSVLQRLSLDGPLFRGKYPKAPFLSINYGAAGAAYALYRLAVLRSDAEQLACADAWATRAHAQRTVSGAFYNEEMGLPVDKIGAISPYHTASGIFLVRALIAHAMGDFVTVQSSIQGFVSAGDQPCENLDLTLGHCSVLVGCSLLVEAIPQHALVDHSPLMVLGDRIAQKILEEVTNFPAIVECKDLVLLGIAHGWAGLLYAQMQWARARRREPGPEIRERLYELGELGEAQGTGMRWKIRLHTKRRSHSQYMSGWCNGSAGMVFLWTLAHEAYKEARFLELAEKAARNAWESGEQASTLCCGSSGSAYALLAMHRAAGDRVWLTRSEELLERAIRYASIGVDCSLYKGNLGVALLAQEIEHPTWSAMPVFEAERWGHHR
jgi:eukaryotic-like serine/threonine-protein kinase